MQQQTNVHILYVNSAESQHSKKLYWITSTVLLEALRFGTLELKQMKWHKIDATLFPAAPASWSFIWLLNIYRGWVWWRRGFNLCGMLIVKSKILYFTFFFDFFLPPFFFLFRKEIINFIEFPVSEKNLFSDNLTF